VYDVVLMQVCQGLQQWLGQAHSHMALCVFVGVADAVVQDVSLPNILLHCKGTAQHTWAMLTCDAAIAKDLQSFFLLCSAACTLQAQS
jgi:hypothetical protein